MDKRKKKRNEGNEKATMKKTLKMAAKHKKIIERLGEKNIEEIVTELQQVESRLLTTVEEACAPPSPRSNFTFIKHPLKDELILFGGEHYDGKRVTVYNDMFFYNINKDEWKLLRVPGGPTARSGHQMVSCVENGGQLWMFGGEHASPSQLQFYHYRDLWMFSIESKKWQMINAPNGPSARSGHRMVIVKQRLITFGGFYDNYQSYDYFNDVHVFDITLKQWFKIDVEGVIVPGPRSGCCIALRPDNSLLIWGGYRKTTLRKRVERGLTYSDMFVLTPNDVGCKWKWSPACPNGYKTLPINSVGFTVAPSAISYCFGGVVDSHEDEEDMQSHFTKDLLSLDLTSLNWNLCKITDQSTAVDASTKESVQTPILTPSPYLSAMPSLYTKQSRNSPTPRMNAGLCECNGYLYVYGGLYEEGDRLYTYNDFYSLNLGTMHPWNVLIPNKENVHVWLESDQSSAESATNTDDSGDEMDTD